MSSSVTLLHARAMLPLCRGCSLLLRSPTLKRLLSTSVDKIRNIGVIAHVDAGKLYPFSNEPMDPFLYQSTGP